MTQGLRKIGNSDKSAVTSLMGRSTGKTIRMTLNQDAAGHIMDRLTDLYPNPVLATVREVVSNAADATVEFISNGGKAKPVEIELPSKLMPEFIVRDYGVGMSPETIENIFATYGGSTKSDKFDQVGAYGLGAKAPLAYCNQFYFETTNNGITSKVTVSRLDSGPETKILSIENTGNISGTTVRIPVNAGLDVEAFRLAISSYRYLSFDVPLMIDGDLCFGNQDYAELGSITIEEKSGTTGRVWVRKESIDNVFETSFVNKNDRSWRYAYLLSGYLYKSPGTYNSNLSAYGSYEHRLAFDGSYSDVIVELKPGVVDFTSSRDEITQNVRSSALDATVNASLLGDGSFLSDAAVRLIAEGRIDGALINKMVTTMNPEVNGNNVVFTNLAGEKSKYKVSDFTDSKGSNIFLENRKFNSSNVFAIARFSESRSSRGRLRGENSGRFSVALKVGSSLSITELNNSVIDSFHSASMDSKTALTLLDAAHVISTRDDDKVYVITGMDDEKKIRRALRGRSIVARKSEKFVYIMDSREKISKAEREVFLNRLPETLREVVEWVDDEFFVKLAAESRKASKKVDSSSRVNFQYQNVEGFDNFDDILNQVTKTQAYGSYRGFDLLDSIYNQNALIIVGEGYVDIFNILNGYVRTNGFAALENRPIFAVNQLLKKAVLELYNSGEEVIRGKDLSHVSIEAQKALNSFPKHYRSINSDIFDSASDREVYAKIFYTENGSGNVLKATEKLSKAVQKCSALGSDVSGIEHFLKFIEWIKHTDASKVPSVNPDKINERFEGKMNPRDVALDVRKFVGSIISDWEHRSSVLASTMVILEANVPEYLSAAALDFVNEKAKELDFSSIM